MNPIKINRDQDITVYKVLGLDENGGLHSPIHDFEWPVGEVMEINDKPEVKEYHYLSYNATSINGNAFHTFREKESAEEFLRKKKGWFDMYKRFAIAECVIPAGSKFIYLGAQDVSDDAYASEKLMVVSYIETE